jgi:hypothetical protein
LGKQFEPPPVEFPVQYCVERERFEAENLRLRDAHFAQNLHSGNAGNGWKNPGRGAGHGGRPSRLAQAEVRRALEDRSIESLRQIEGGRFDILILIINFHSAI